MVRSERNATAPVASYSRTPDVHRVAYTHGRAKSALYFEHSGVVLYYSYATCNPQVPYQFWTPAPTRDLGPQAPLIGALDFEPLV